MGLNQNMMIAILKFARIGTQRVKTNGSNACCKRTKRWWNSESPEGTCMHFPERNGSKAWCKKWVDLGMIFEL